MPKIGLDGGTKTKRASSTLRASQAVPHPSTDRALRRLTSEFGRDPVYSSRYGRWRYISSSLGGMQNENPCEPIFNKKKSPRSAEAQRGEIVHGSLSKTLTEPTTKADAQLRPHRYPSRVAQRGRKKRTKKNRPAAPKRNEAKFFMEACLSKTLTEPTKADAQLRPHRYPNRVALRGRKKGQKKIAPKRRSATRRNFSEGKNKS